MKYVIVQRTGGRWVYAGHYDNADEARAVLARLQEDHDLYEIGTCHDHVWEALCALELTPAISVGLLEM